LKKITISLFGILEFSLLFSVLLFFVATNEKTTIYLIDKAVKSLDIKYGKLEGNIFQEIKMRDISYKNETLAKQASLDISFKSLLQAKFKINDIRLQKVDLSVLQELILEQKRKKKKRKKRESIPTINIENIFFSTLPYTKGEISIDEFKFNANDVQGDLTNLKIGSFSLYNVSNLTNITADGEIKNGILNLNHLWVKKIDFEKIKNFYEKEVKNKEQNSSSKKDEEWFQNIIKIIKIDNFKADTKPYDYKKYKIQELKIDAKKIISDLKSYDVKKLKIKSKTNMWELASNGYIKKNRLFTNVEVILNDKYFKRFIPFFNHNNIKPITLSLILDKDGLSSKINLKTSNLLIKKQKKLEFGVKNATSSVVVDFKPLLVNVKIDGNLTSKYSQNITLSSHLLFDKTFTYKGELFIPKLKNIDKNISSLMENSTLTFNGDKRGIKADLKNKNLNALFQTQDYKKGLLEINSSTLILSEYLKSLPPKLSNLQATLDAKIPINFKNLDRYEGEFTVKSNLANFEGKASYKDEFILNAKATAIKNSILKNYDKNLKLKAFFPLKIHTNLKETKIEHKEFLATLKHTDELNATLNIKGEKFYLNRYEDNKLIFKTKIISLKTLQEKAHKFYDFEVQPLDGELDLTAIIYPNNNINFKVKSRWLVYEYKPNKFLFGEKIKINLNKKGENYEISDYYISTFLDYDRIFKSLNASQFSYKNKKLIVENFWINDQATLKGEYDFAKTFGEFSLKSKNYHYKGVEGEIYFNADLNSVFKKNEIKIDGKIEVLKGEVNYEAKKKHYIQDEDIIIIQDIKEKDISKDSNLLINVSLITKKPIYYKIKNTKATIDLELQLWKEAKKELEFLGVAKILNGVHMEGDKEFKVQSSEILFAGAALNPFLNLNITHKSDPYNISINVSGLLDSPSINFSSTPFLTQSDILSVLLFNSTTADLASSDTDSSKAALSMFGNTFAKELVENFGIKLDKLILSTNEEGGFGVEVGKKISRKMTIIYINDIVQTIKVKYQHSKRFETDIIFSPDSSGIDFLYKNEY